MATKTLLQLGVALDRIFPRLRRRIDEQLVPALVSAPRGLRDLVITTFAEAWLEGGQTGYRVTASYLGAPANISPANARRWREAAVRHGEFILSRFEAVLGGDVTAQSAGVWAKQAGESSVWRGTDEVSDDLAHLEAVEFKQWVRAWPRKLHRSHHDRLEGVTIPIDDLFTLPGGRYAGAQVYGPRAWDVVNDPGEHLSCGHALRFLRQATGEDLSETMRQGNVVYSPPTQSAVFGR
jgi:hypothetical protein